jgi:hypothetical protein
VNLPQVFTLLAGLVGAKIAFGTSVLNESTEQPLADANTFLGITCQ